MVNNYFESVCEIISTNERMKKFSFNKLGEYATEFVCDDVNYRVEYDSEKSLIKLFGVDKDTSEKRAVASWLMELEKCTSKDINMIANDFIQAMAGKQASAIAQKSKKKRNLDESNITGLFFANRMVSMFPQLKEKIQDEKQLGNDFRAVYFTETYILPCIKEFLIGKQEKSRINKFGKLLSDLYHSGTLDVRSIITMGILCGLNDEKAENVLRGVISDELNKAWNASLKYKGKNVKPEKIKKRKSFMSKLLDAQENMNK